MTEFSLYSVDWELPSVELMVLHNGNIDSNFKK